MNWRNTRDYRLWRVAVIKRDKVCMVCSDRKARHAHHLNHATYFPDEKFLPENGITLCQKCHSHFHNDYKSSTRAKCTKHDMKEYRKLADYFMEKSIYLTMKRLQDEDLLREIF